MPLFFRKSSNNGFDSSSNAGSVKIYTQLTSHWTNSKIHKLGIKSKNSLKWIFEISIIILAIRLGERMTFVFSVCPRPWSSARQAAPKVFKGNTQLLCPLFLPAVLGHINLSWILRTPWHPQLTEITQVLNITLLPPCQLCELGKQTNLCHNKSWRPPVTEKRIDLLCGQSRCLQVIQRGRTSCFAVRPGELAVQRGSITKTRIQGPCKMLWPSILTLKSWHFNKSSKFNLVN